MINLQQVLNQYPNSINDFKKMRSLLLDLYPQEKKRDIIILVSFIECGIVDEIRNFKRDITLIDKKRFLKKIEEEYGYARSLCEPILDLWIDTIHNQRIEEAKQIGPSHPEIIDITNEIRAIILTVIEMEQKNNSHGIKSISSAIRGADTVKTRDYKLNELENFGILSDLSFVYAEQIINFALENGWLKRVIENPNDFMSKIISTSKGKSFLKNNETIRITPYWKHFNNNKYDNSAYLYNREKILSETIDKRIKKYCTSENKSNTESDFERDIKDDSKTESPLIIKEPVKLIFPSITDIKEKIESETIEEKDFTEPIHNQPQSATTFISEDSKPTSNNKSQSPASMNSASSWNSGSYKGSDTNYDYYSSDKKRLVKWILGIIIFIMILIWCISNSPNPSTNTSPSSAYIYATNTASANKPTAISNIPPSFATHKIDIVLGKQYRISYVSGSSFAGYYLRYDKSMVRIHSKNYSGIVIEGLQEGKAILFIDNNDGKTVDTCTIINVLITISIIMQCLKSFNNLNRRIYNR